MEQLRYDGYRLVWEDRFDGDPDESTDFDNSVMEVEYVSVYRKA